MKYKYVCFIVLFAVFLTACSIFKKQSQSPSAYQAPAEPSINLDTISIFSDAPVKKTVYQATHTITNDILHTKLWVSFDWQNAQLIGKAEIQVKPYFYPTNKLYLNARGMEIKSVHLLEKQVKDLPIQKGTKSVVYETTTIEKPVKYNYENDSINITLDKIYTSKEAYTVVVEYIAKPNDLKPGGSAAITEDKGLYFINPTGKESGKMPQVWTQGETQANSAWFPTIDNPTEKMTNEIYMTVDDKYTTLSNGLLVNFQKNADGTRTDHWVMDLPHAPYLVMMAVGEFKKVMDESWNGKEISYYVEKEYEPHAKAIFGKTKKMIELYSNLLGVPYPWQKYSQIVVRDFVSGAMENTSATLHGDFMCYQTTRETIDGVKGESVIAHELFHQWFGDLASCESWSHLTLNESFATYGEYLWEEFEYGRDAADDHHAQSRFGYYVQSQEKLVDLVRFDYENREDMFDAVSYNKGGQILHMLRKYVGDDAFFASLKSYLKKNKFKTAEAHDLRLAFEETTGEDLNWFFNQWYFSKGHPELEVIKSYDVGKKKLKLEINQKQNTAIVPLYKLPIDVDIYSEGKKERRRIWLSETKNTFMFDVLGEPDLVNVDAERQLLAKISYVKTANEYIFQYKNAALWGDRAEAINYFKQHLSDTTIFEIVKLIAKQDSWQKFRIDAINALGKIAKEKKSELMPLLLSIAKQDSNTKVRAAAIKVLAENYENLELNVLYENALNEQSYAIVSEGFNAIVKLNPKLAMQKALFLENEPSKEIVYSVGSLYAKHGNDSNIYYFKKVKKHFNGYELMTYVSLYGQFLKRCTMPLTMIEGATDIANIGNTDNKYVNYTSKKVLKEDLLNTWEQKENELKEKIENAKKNNIDTSFMLKELEVVSDTKKQMLDLYNSIKK